MLSKWSSARRLCAAKASFSEPIPPPPAPLVATSIKHVCRGCPAKTPFSKLFCFCFSCCGNDVPSICRVLQARAISPEEQFDAFDTILEQYLLPTSPDEVNIESKMSKRMASFKHRYSTQTILFG